MRLLALFIVVCISLSGCVYSSANLVRVQGTDVTFSMNPILNTYTASGKTLAATIFRQSGIVKTNKDGSKEKPISMPDIKETPGEWALDNAPQQKD